MSPKARNSISARLEHLSRVFFKHAHHSNIRSTTPMGQIFTIHPGDLVTTLFDTCEKIRYSIESTTMDGWRALSIRGVSQSRSLTGDAPDFWYDELARVQWHDHGIFIWFGSRKVNADSYLQKEGRFSNSRIFLGPKDEIFRWKVKGDGLELRHKLSGTLVACSHSFREGIGVFAIKPRAATLDVIAEYSSIPQMLDKIVVTWVILDGIMRNNDLRNSP